MVGLTDFLKLEQITQAGVDLAVGHHLVIGQRLLVVCPMRSLETLLTHPVVAEIHHRGEARRSSATDHHSTGLTHKDACRDCRLAGMLEDDVGVATLA